MILLVAFPAHEYGPERVLDPVYDFDVEAGEAPVLAFVPRILAGNRFRGPLARRLHHVEEPGSHRGEADGREHVLACRDN